MNYVLAVQAPAFPLAAGRFATESAFARHLIELRERLASEIDRIVLVAPQMTPDVYEAGKQSLAEVSVDEHGIELLPAHFTNDSALSFWRRRAVDLWRRIGRANSDALVVHSGLCDDIWRPLLAMVNLSAWLKGKPIIFIVDIDFRKDTARFYRTGVWSFKSYVVNKLLYDPLKLIQVWLAARSFRLSLLKSTSMVRDYGRGRPSVRFFLDTVHSPGDVLTSDQSNARIDRLLRSRPLRLIYFGRLVGYKGIDLTIDAVRIARSRGADVTLTVLGDGVCRGTLEAASAASGLAGVVEFRGAVEYGPDLFRIIDEADAAIATPKVEDTPRGALDAMARGLPIIAFDIEYYQSLAQMSGAVALARWPSPEEVADQIVRLSNDRRQLADMSVRAIAFAAENTQGKWLETRLRWTKEAIAAGHTEPKGLSRA